MACPVLCLRGESACSFRLYLVHSTRPGRGPRDRCPANRRARSGDAAGDQEISNLAWHSSDRPAERPNDSRPQWWAETRLACIR
jgi:hypothetical protein